MKYCHLFGPVASRRLGVSLGVDLVTHKICSLDCVYCECGKTTDLTLERKSWVPFERVRTELDHYWDHHDNPDYITFSGSGEPCLNRDLGKVIAYIKEKKPGIRVAVLTNATLLSDHKVRKELARADLVVPSLDAVSEAVFARLNRPHISIRPDQVVTGIQEFTRAFRGRVHLEIFILPGVNDTKDELALLKQAVETISPDLVQLNSLDRPGTQDGLQSATLENLERIKQLLGPDRVEIIARVSGAARASRQPKDLGAAVLETIHRRPCTCRDLSSMLGADARIIQALLDDMVDKGIAVSKQEGRGQFYHTLKL